MILGQEKVVGGWADQVSGTREQETRHLFAEVREAGCG